MNIPLLNLRHMALAFAVWCQTYDAEAASSIGTLASSTWVTEVKNIAKAAVPFAGLVGLVFFIMGIMKLIDAKKNRQPVGEAILYLLAGVALAIVTYFMGAISATMTGSDQASQALGKLGLGQ